ncbi:MULTISPECIES: DUF4843 domain-containing protein [unclassified Pedobacter]|jgi:hypothetical protein|uniref:DUF4843 domain-containing protein n=1 Tax=unclassified Pedobacter TaxID=2628915 RepID=UPI001304EBA3|nr:MULTISPECIES: DUF4843 domain-containing protein [unclassified Pedobacter]HWW41784.1 DUF4843 domain-containing protein [Pedobacter sp.]
MKKIYLNFTGLLAILILFSCKKDLHTYEGKPTIYFNESARRLLYQGEVLKDSTVLSFSLAKAKDSTVNMVVTIIGAKQDIDRPYRLVVNPVSNAVAGTQYQILNTAFVIRKNQLSDTVKIKFFRREEMQTKTLLLSLDLLENENFSVSMKNKIINTTTGKTQSFINYRWFVNDIIKRPSMWFDAYLGTFTRKKLLLMAEVLGIEPAYLDNGASIVEVISYGKFMQRYLNDQRVAGHTILEDDGTVMEMGYYVQ